MTPAQRTTAITWLEDAYAELKRAIRHLDDVPSFIPLQAAAGIEHALARVIAVRALLAAGGEVAEERWTT
jgi:3-deoxy-D-arabino-heptulosonate 7-phosphate (DAHP) synthase class II